VGYEFRATHECRVTKGRLMADCDDCIKHRCHECHEKAESWWADYCRKCFAKTEVHARWLTAPAHHPHT
jgi:hypothetical protein